MARVGRDPEGVHRLRVSAGRLDTWLRLAGLRVFRDDLRWLRRRAAAVRDVDVLLASRPPEPFARWLSRRRAQDHRALVRALASERFEALCRGLALLPPLPRKEATARVARLAERALRRADRLAADSDLDSFHALRRAARRLRYGLEWIGQDAEDLEALQDALGEVGDAAVALRLLERCPAARRLGAYRERQARRLERAKTAVHERWLAREARKRT